MTKQEILKMYEVDTLEEFITSPGKFEGEFIFAPYFYDKYLNGFSEEIWEDDSGGSDTLVSIFDVDDEDRKEFPFLLDDTEQIRLWETGSGFVITERILKEGE